MGLFDFEEAGVRQQSVSRLSGAPQDRPNGLWNRLVGWSISACWLPLCVLPGAGLHAQLITMSGECRESIASADASVATRQYAQALDTFDSLVEECDSRDAREAIQVGRAQAFNGIGDHVAAMEAANLALEATDQSSLNALFERATAEEQMGDLAASSADLDRIIQLTEKNTNVSERATIYAKVADLKYRSDDRGSAGEYLDQAMQLDPENPDFHIQRGDWATVNGDYETAFTEYDRAVSLGKADAEMYEIRSEARLAQMQQKYQTTNVQQLRSQMTDNEKTMVCSETAKAAELGLANMQLDMFTALTCR